MSFLSRIWLLILSGFCILRISWTASPFPTIDADTSLPSKNHRRDDGVDDLEALKDIYWNHEELEEPFPPKLAEDKILRGQIREFTTNSTHFNIYPPSYSPRDPVTPGTNPVAFLDIYGESMADAPTIFNVSILHFPGREGFLHTIVKTRPTDELPWLIGGAQIQEDIITTLRRQNPSSQRAPHWPFVVRVIDYFEDQTTGIPCVILERMEGTIRDIAENMSQRREFIQTVFAHMLTAVQAVHQAGYAQRHLALRNFFYTIISKRGKLQEIVVKIGDFNEALREPGPGERRLYSTGDPLHITPGKDK